MSSIKKQYASSAAITITLANLAPSGTNTEGQQSTAIDNSSNGYVDAIVQILVKLVTGTPAGEKLVNVYAYGSEDGASYPDGVSGTDGAITLKDPPNFKKIGEIYCPNPGGVSYRSRPMSVAKAFDWLMPRKWGIVVVNNTNLAFTATGGDHAASFSGVTFLNV